jgi:uridylate kinase
VLSYGLVKIEYNSFLLSDAELINKVKDLINRNAKTICNDDRLRVVIFSLEEHFPSIR